jgi:hypothetical protein
LPLVSKRQRLQLQLNQLQQQTTTKTKVEKYDTGYDTRSKRSAYFMLPQHFTDQAGEMTKTYTVKPLSFAAQMKIHDAGYHSILPTNYTITWLMEILYPQNLL